NDHGRPLELARRWGCVTDVAPTATFVTHPRRRARAARGRPASRARRSRARGPVGAPREWAHDLRLAVVRYPTPSRCGVDLARPWGCGRKLSSQDSFRRHPLRHGTGRPRSITTDGRNDHERAVELARPWGWVT